MMSKQHFPVLSAFMLMAFLFAASASGILAAEPPVAMVTEVSGDGEFLREGTENTLRLFAELELNARVRLKKGARMVVLYLQSGDQYALSGPGSFTLGQDQPRAEKKTAGPTKLGPVTGKNGKAMQIRNASLSQAGIVPIHSAGIRVGSHRSGHGLRIRIEGRKREHVVLSHPAREQAVASR
jgi:hypothetical protein